MSSYINKFIFLILILFLILFISDVYSLECISYHDFYEQGKSRRINLGFCGASTGYCVRAVYSDPNYSNKNGFSLGCDKTDCIHVGDPDYGWDDNNCKTNTDFGLNGFICCCNDHDHCNHALSSFKTIFSSILISIITYFIL